MRRYKLTQGKVKKVPNLPANASRPEAKGIHPNNGSSSEKTLSTQFLRLRIYENYLDRKTFLTSWDPIKYQCPLLEISIHTFVHSVTELAGQKRTKFRHRHCLHCCRTRHRCTCVKTMSYMGHTVKNV